MLLEDISTLKSSRLRRGIRFASSQRGLMALVELHQRAIELESIQEETPSANTISPAILRDLLTCLHFRDENTFLHSRRVSMIVVGLAKQLCWNSEAIREIELAAMLHDIGKIGIPDHILFKPGKYTVEEASLMALRTAIAEDILEICRIPLRIRNIIVESRLPFSRMEDYLRPLGKDLSQAGRLLAVADAYESLSRDQIYRDAKSKPEITNILNERAGSLYDASIVQTLIRWIDNGGEAALQEVGRESAMNGLLVNGGASLAMTSLCNIFSHLYTLEQAYDGFAIVGVDGRILLANRGCRSIFQQADKDWSGQSWSNELCPQADPYQNFLADKDLPLNQTMVSKVPATFNVKVPLPDHLWEELEVQSIPMFDFNDELIGVGEFYRLKQRNKVESAKFRELALQASRDALTGVANRGTLENQLSRAMANFKKDPVSNLFSVIYLDIDHFKSINDTFGHATGDDVLVTLAKLLREEAYSSEFVARYGGEEFVILCPELAAEQAVKRAERFRTEIAKLSFETASSLKITSSFGVSQVEVSDSLESVLKRADKALYQSKNQGRNRTTLIQQSDIHAETKPENSKEGYQFEASIDGVLFDQFLILKLQGFAEQNRAKLLKVKEGDVHFQLGRKGFFKRWGKNEDQQPVLVQIDATAALSAHGSRTNSQRMNVKITPIGLPPNPEKFKLRARYAYRMLRSHFLSQE
ncbi:diguanylate cyclase [Rubinisphaera sp.]|mgnify:CR=1 FL=1|uniref:diguanylate cyclase n=1 Tax=Rubinisphaera sp. TaxID=2024857 RepID=UPI000C1211D6|nr:diguanylate cyclase [Rubinisphaera sp.]MBV08577.1 hypothetical protein [Rubinisphaera sp.]HCS55446.1 hypothetical protein [Planctomycetaceae bacterium]|tara:strand:- start:4215 stop:6317 length:2103 start_codon:yes stop_codon:yes gene_type:complete